MVYRSCITSQSDDKENAERHMRNIPQFMLFSTVEYAILRFLMVADNGEQHIEHVLQFFVDYLYVFNKPMLCHLGEIFKTHCLFIIDKIPIILFYPEFI